MGASCRHQGRADAATPPVRINIERTQLPMVRRRRVARRCAGGKASDHACFNRNDRLWLTGVRAGEVVPLRPFLRPQPIEIVTRKQVSVAHLPRAHVHARHAHRIIGFGCSQKHARL